MLIEITYNVTDVYMSTTETPIYVEISFEQPGGSAAVWGSITGTLSNQTDLQNALNAKVPYTGATGNVDLGEYELKAGQVEFDQTPTGTAGVGVMRWNDADGTVDLGLKGGNVTLQVGQEQVARVVNKTGANLLESEYKVVKVSSAQGQRLAVDLAQANNDNNSADTLGIVTENIDNNQEGFITTMGTIRGINTTGSLQGETWTDGDVLYLSGTTAGAITNVKPTAPLHIVVVGYVEYAHSQNGKIFVKVMNGWEIDELHNVLISSPTNNQGLFYNSSNSLWENKSITTALGYTPVPTTRNITINGVTYDLSADRTYTISAGISGSIATGQVAYATAANTIGGTSTFTYDGSNTRLNIGNSLPTNTATNNIVISSSLVGFSAKNTSVSNNAQVGVYLENNSSSLGQLFKTGSNSTAYKIISANDLGFYNTTSGDIAILNDWASGRVKFSAGASSTSQMTLFANGNLAINSGVTDLGVKFGVVGDTLLRGSGNTSATTALTVQNSSSVNILQVLNNGYIRLGNGGNSAFRIYPGSVSSGGDVDLGGEFLTLNARSNTTDTSTGGFVHINGVIATATTGTQNVLSIQKGFAPTSGNAVHTSLIVNPTINQTGGANGITRGLYVNPTLTSAADFRAIETSAGNVLFGSNFFWDNTNSRLGIGTNAPSNKLVISGSETAVSGFARGILIDTTLNAASNADLLIGLDIRPTFAQGGFTGASPIAMRLFNPNTNAALDYGIQFRLQNTRTGQTGADGLLVSIDNQNIPNGYFWNYEDASLIFGTNNSSRVRIWNNGNVGIGFGSTDPAVRLGVLGDTLLRGSGASSATTALTVQNSSSANMLRMLNDTTLKIGSQNIDIFPTANGSTVSNAGRGLVISTNASSQTDAGALKIIGGYSSALGSDYGIWVSHSFTNGTGGVAIHNGILLNQTINQTGGANGITRGLYVNPTLTAAADFRAIETTNGKIIFGNLPTSSAGLPSGALWNDAGTVKIV